MLKYCSDYYCNSNVCRCISESETYFYVISLRLKTVNYTKLIDHKQNTLYEHTHCPPKVWRLLRKVGMNPFEFVKVLH